MPSGKEAETVLSRAQRGAEKICFAGTLSKRVNLPVLVAEVLESGSVTYRFGSYSYYPFLCVLDSAVFNVSEETQNKAWATTVTSVSEGEVMFGPPGEKHPGGEFPMENLPGKEKANIQEVTMLPGS
ncbi:hypothetical protein E5288_WYG008722 [Bos mutus]|uniref:Uncharacterized protein n=1 Tax=Bos mutus TaxID=72004 RepID=A0A6B0S760_9CETA|nr:hypothetical protein [Bos mutus]